MVAGVCPKIWFRGADHINRLDHHAHLKNNECLKFEVPKVPKIKGSTPKHC